MRSRQSTSNATWPSSSSATLTGTAIATTSTHPTPVTRIITPPIPVGILAVGSGVRGRSPHWIVDAICCRLSTGRAADLVSSPAQLGGDHRPDGLEPGDRRPADGVEPEDRRRPGDVDPEVRRGMLLVGRYPKPDPLEVSINRAEF